MHSKNLFCHHVQIWKNYLHLLTNWMHSKSFIWKGVPIWNNYLHLLANWMHSKSFIWKGVPTWNNYLHICWPIECNPKVLFERVFWFEIITFIYVGQLNAIQKFYLKGCYDLKELPSYVGQLNAIQNLDLLKCPNWNNYIYLSNNWMHSKSFICKNVSTWNN
jgi:hypothetical protein